MARKRVTITKKAWKEIDEHTMCSAIGPEAWFFCNDWFKASDETVILVIEKRAENASLRLVGRPLVKRTSTSIFHLPMKKNKLALSRGGRA